MAALTPMFQKLQSQFGFHECGEGGEYETLTLDAPFFARRIVLDETEVQLHSDDMFAPVAHLHVVSFHLEDKLDFQALLPPLDLPAASPMPLSSPATFPATSVQVVQAQGALWLAADGHGLVVCSGTCGTLSRNDLGREPCGRCSTHMQLQGLLQGMENALDAAGLGLEGVAFAWVYLADMADFQKANEAYVQHMRQRPAPGRACVGVGCKCLPHGSRVALEMVAGRLGVGLQVQSVSEWAAACIGPYGQAGSLVGQEEALTCFMAGTIGLEARGMGLLPRSRQEEAARRHGRRVRAVLPSLALGHQTVFVACRSADVQACEVAEALGEFGDEWLEYEEEELRVPELRVAVDSLPANAAVELEWALQQQPWAWGLALVVPSTSTLTSALTSTPASRRALKVAHLHDSLLEALLPRACIRV